MNRAHDFAAIKLDFETFSPGEKADIRRTALPEDLRVRGAFYRLLPEGERPTPQWQRVIFFLPWAEHDPDAPPLGAQLATSEKSISEIRIFQLLRSENPQDLLHLRRLLQHIKTTLDWGAFGERLWFWGESVKSRIVEEYFSFSRSKK